MFNKVRESDVVLLLLVIIVGVVVIVTDMTPIEMRGKEIDLYIGNGTVLYVDTPAEIRIEAAGEGEFQFVHGTDIKKSVQKEPPLDYGYGKKYFYLSDKITGGAWVLERRNLRTIEAKLSAEVPFTVTKFIKSSIFAKSWMYSSLVIGLLWLAFFMKQAVLFLLNLRKKS